MKTIAMAVFTFLTVMLLVGMGFLAGLAGLAVWHLPPIWIVLKSIGLIVFIFFMCFLMFVTFRSYKAESKKLAKRLSR